jgi:16S rRNA (uracil1498-N3)-methyltransferase
MVPEMAERFYVNCPLVSGPMEIEGPEAHHLAGVCRIRPGDQVCLFNGDGHEYPAQVLSAGRRRVTLEVSGRHSPPRELPFRLEVAGPLPKGDRAHFLLEKLTELGVSTFVPLQTVRSVVHPRETRLEKLQRYVIEASKQCGRNVLLQVQPLADFPIYCRRDNLPPDRVLAHPGGDRGKRGNGAETARQEVKAGPDAVAGWPYSPVPASGLAVAVGPEGGFTEEEVEAALAAGWRLLDLGPRILRIETAALLLAARAALPECGRVP